MHILEKLQKFSLEEIDVTTLRQNVAGLLRHFEPKWRARIRDAAIQLSQAFHAKFSWSDDEKDSSLHRWRYRLSHAACTQQLWVLNLAMREVFAEGAKASR